MSQSITFEKVEIIPDKNVQLETWWYMLSYQKEVLFLKLRKIELENASKN